MSTEENAEGVEGLESLEHGSKTISPDEIPHFLDPFDVSLLNMVRNDHPAGMKASKGRIIADVLAGPRRKLLSVAADPQATEEEKKAARQHFEKTTRAVEAALGEARNDCAACYRAYCICLRDTPTMDCEAPLMTCLDANGCI